MLAGQSFNCVALSYCICLKYCHIAGSMHYLTWEGISTACFKGDGIQLAFSMLDGISVLLILTGFVVLEPAVGTWSSI